MVLQTKKNPKKDERQKDPNAIALARIRWDKATPQEKSDNARRASLVAAEKRMKPLLAFVCECGVGDALQGHKSTCLRGRAIKRRNIFATAPNTPTTPTETADKRADGSEGKR